MRLPDAQLVAVSDAFARNAQDLATQTGAQVRSSDEIIASGDIDAVIICTPTDTHYDLIHAAAKARKAIFCEKPVDMSADRIRDCISVVEAYGAPFMTAFNRRFDPNFAAIQSRITAGEVGNVELVTILSRDPAPPPISYIKTSGGIFRDMMIHDFDMARFLLGEDAVQVFAVGSALVDPDIGAAGDVDTAAVTLTTASGKICQISNSRRASYGYDQRVEVHGSSGLLRAENVLENSVELGTAAGFRRAPTMNFFLERYERAYLAEMSHFVDAVMAGRPLFPSIGDGLKAQLMADAASLSLAEGRPVTI
ncbi:MAG: myo-inositol 2-dehydrogenase/D-chiro-inositol 1-dehydrogenase [Sulfitobacter pontiacus]|jgi:myo-inositol 2-dehydrogenase/D-chiro-inositol 1-dehydrogenase